MPEIPPPPPSSDPYGRFAVPDPYVRKSSFEGLARRMDDHLSEDATVHNELRKHATSVSVTLRLVGAVVMLTFATVVGFAAWVATSVARNATSVEVIAAEAERHTDEGHPRLRGDVVRTAQATEATAQRVEYLVTIVEDRIENEDQRFMGRSRSSRASRSRGSSRGNDGQP